MRHEFPGIGSRQGAPLPARGPPLWPTRREFLGLASVPEDEERYGSDRLAEQAHCERIGRSPRPRQVAIYGHWVDGESVSRQLDHTRRSR